MLTVARGNGTEAKVLAALVDAGYGVLLPFGDGQPFDMVTNVEGVFYRVQCKTAWRKDGCLIFNSRSTDHGRGAMSYVGRADVFGVYAPSTTSVYLVPVDAFNTEGRLRLEPTRNNQQLGIRFASDYEISLWTPERFAALRR